MMGYDPAAYQQLYAQQAQAFQQAAQAAAGISQFPGFAGASAQPAQQAVPAQPASQAPAGPVECVGQTAHLTVSGCTHGTVGGIVRGNFTANGQNHGKPTYKKDQQVNGLDVMLYYWDERDGPNFCGWWFGPKVGGDQVWAYHPSRQSLTPPTKGWKVPYDGPVDDSFSICPTSLANANAAQQNYPQGFQQAPGKGGGYQAPGAYAGQQPGPGAGGKGGYGNMPQNDQQRHELQAQNRRQHEQRRAMQRREEEMRQQQQAEAMRKAAAQKMQMEEEQRRVAEQKRKEQEACSSIRAVCQRMRMVQEESFPQLQQELYDVMQRELNNCGMQMAKIREECDQIVDQARRRLQEAAEVKAFQEKKKAEMLEAHKVACAKAEQLVADFTAKVEAAEEAANALVEKAEPFTSDESVMNLGSEDKILEEASKIDEARDEAAARTAECQEYLKENRPAMTIQDMPGQPPAEVKQVLAKVMDRLTETAKKKDGVMVKIMVVKSKAMRRSKAKKTLEDRKAKFTKYAKDGVLDKKQMTVYCKKEFNLALKEDTAARIFKALQVTKGVAAADFQRLRVQIGIIRESIKDQARLKVRLEREKELEASKEEVREKIEELSGKADEVEAPVKQVEDAILELSKVDKDSTRASQMHEKCAEVFPDLPGFRVRRPAVIPGDVGTERSAQVNCTTALQRYAKALGSGPGRPDAARRGGQKRPAEAEETLRRLLLRTAELAQSAGTQVPPQNLANALWAAERLVASPGAPQATLAAIARKAMGDPKRLKAFSGQHLANIAWATAKLLTSSSAAQLLKSAGAASQEAFLEPLCSALETRAWDLNAQELSMAAWALGTAGYDNHAATRVVATLGEAARWQPDGAEGLSAQQLATMAWACARLGCRSEALLQDIAKAATPKVARGDFNAQDLVNMTWAYGRLEFSAEALRKVLAKAATRFLAKTAQPNRRHSGTGFSASQLAVVAWSLARMGVRESKTLKAIAEEATQRVSELLPRDVTDIVWALAHAQTPAPGFMASAAGYAKARQSSFGTQELLRFLGAFRRAGGDAEAYAEMTSRQQELRYDFPALGGFQVALQAATPGQPSRTRRRVRAAALREQSELKGDPQRADGGTTGVALWEASFVLAEWLSRQGDRHGCLLACSALQELLTGAGKAERARWRRWRGKVGVELGAGLGLPSIVASQLGAHVVATDGDASVLTLLRRNVEENRGSGALRAEALLWGSEDPLSKIGLDERPDFLLAADVIYASAKEALGRQLLDTLLKLSKPDTVIIISNVRRFHEGQAKGEGRFFALCDSCYERASLAPGELHPDFRRAGVGSCEIHLLRLRSDAVPASPVSPKRRRAMSKGTKVKVKRVRCAAAPPKVLQLQDMRLAPNEAFSPTTWQKHMQSQEIVAPSTGTDGRLANAVAAIIKSAQQSVQAVRKEAADMREGIEADLKTWAVNECKPLDGKCTGFERRIRDAERKHYEAEAYAHKKEQQEVSACHVKALEILKHHQKVKEMTTEDLVKAVAGDGETVTKENFISFFDSCEKEEGAAPPPKEDLGRYFDFLDDEKEGFLTQEHMLTVVRTLKKVTKETTITDTAEVSEETQTLSKLEVGDLLELLSEPSEHGDLLRARCRAMKDGTRGWVSVKSNNAMGPVFLQDGGRIWRVQK
ncbi:VCPKMT, partial [Symbiodinium sp. CCMP2456]